MDLGEPSSSNDGFTYWSGSLSDLDEDLDGGECFQISNKDPGGSIANRRPSISRDEWFVVATSESAIRILASEMGCIARGIKKV